MKRETNEKLKAGAAALSEKLQAANARSRFAAGLAPDVARHQHDRHHTHGARGPPALAGLMLLRLPAVERITGLKKSQIFDAIERGIFPRPVRILENGRAVGWLAGEIEDFIASRIAARDAVAAVT
jgi:prophage regulatory protein